MNYHLAHSLILQQNVELVDKKHYNFSNIYFENKKLGDKSKSEIRKHNIKMATDKTTYKFIRIAKSYDYNNR